MGRQKSRVDLNLTLMEGFLSDESFGKQILFLSSVHFLLCIIFSVDFFITFSY